MKTTDFAKYLSAFLTRYLAGERNYSPNTILAYKDAFIAYINLKVSSSINLKVSS